MSAFDNIGMMIMYALEAVGIVRSNIVDCPECGETMERIRRKPPRKPYFMDYAHYCDQCDHEVEAGHVLPNFGRRKPTD